MVEKKKVVPDLSNDNCSNIAFKHLEVILNLMTLDDLLYDNQQKGEKLMNKRPLSYALYSKFSSLKHRVKS